MVSYGFAGRTNTFLRSAFPFQRSYLPVSGIMFRCLFLTIEYALLNEPLSHVISGTTWET